MMRDRSKLFAVVFTLVLLVGAVAVRWNGFDQPHWGIDEGVTFTIGQQIAEGDVLYREAVDHRTPLVPYLKAAVFLVAGDWNIFAVRFVVALLLGLSALLIWRLAKRLGNEPAGVAAAVLHLLVTYIYFNIPDGPSASTAWFLIFFSTGGFWAFAHAVTRPSLKRGLGVGLWFGLATMCKQPALLDFGVTWVLIALALWRQPEDRRALAKMFGGQLVGALIPTASFALFFAAKGVWNDFIYYVFTYNTEVYVPVIDSAARWHAMRTPFLLAWERMPGIGILAVVGGAALLLTVAWEALSSAWKTLPEPSTHRGPRWPVLPWLILGWSASGIVSTGLSGREFAHYSAQVIPGLTLAGGWVLALLYRGARSPNGMRWVWRCFGSGVAVTVATLSVRTAITTHRDIGTSVSGDLNVGELIAHHTSPKERIFVWGYFPEYHLMARRLPATRFVYTNFLTGFVPWENMDSFIDTSDLETPGAWDAMRADFAAHPPALVVERELGRAQAKYPLNERPIIWKSIIDHYAEVSFNVSRNAVRFYRRYDAVIDPLANALPTKEDSTLELTAVATYRPNQTTSLTLRAPPGWNRFALWADGVAVRSLPHSASDPVNMHFFDPQGELQRAREIRVVGRRIDGSLACSEAFDFGAAAALAEQAQNPGPYLTINGERVPPSIIEHVEDNTFNWEPEPGAVQLRAPARLVYDCHQDARRVDFVHGLRPDIYELTDGYDIVVSWLPDDGSPPQRIWATRLLIREEGRFRYTQHQSLELPDRGPGKLEFRFLAGIRSDQILDILFFGDDAESVIHPIMTLNGAPYLTAHDNAYGISSVWSRNAVGGWIIHAPGGMTWELPAHNPLAAIYLDYGVEDGAFSPDGGQTDGVTFSVELKTDASSEPQVLFSRYLDPLQNPADRGRQTSRVDLPHDAQGILTIRTGEGPHGNGAWDWAWIDDPRGVLGGPPIQMPRDAAAITAIATSGPVHGHEARSSDDRWSSHSPSELTYPKPKGLKTVRFGFGLEETVPLDEQGRVKSDGVVVVVNWIPDGDGEVRQLYHRHLDPSSRDEDLGPQQAEVELPAEQSGQLQFRMEPGPNDNTAYDWAYWSRFWGNPTL